MGDDYASRHPWEIPPADLALCVLAHEVEHVNQSHKRRRLLYRLLSPVVKSWRPFTNKDSNMNSDLGVLKNYKALLPKSLVIAKNI